MRFNGNPQSSILQKQTQKLKQRERERESCTDRGERNEINKMKKSKWGTKQWANLRENGRQRWGGKPERRSNGRGMIVWICCRSRYRLFQVEIVVYVPTANQTEWSRDHSVTITNKTTLWLRNSITLPLTTVTFRTLLFSLLQLFYRVLPSMSFVSFPSFVFFFPSLSPLCKSNFFFFVGIMA